MKIISLDELERQTDIPTWGNSKAKFSQIKNPDNLNFTCNKNLSLSQSLSKEDKRRHQEKSCVNNYKTVCIPYIGYNNNFCHNLIDILPELLYLDGTEKYDLILAPHSQVTENLINTFNIKFQNIKFIKNDFIFTSQTIDLYQYNIDQRRINKSLKLREVLLKQINITANPDKLIYCTRNTGGGAKHGRKMNAHNEDTIIKLSKHYAQSNDLDFIVFDGRHKDGSIMSILEQAQLFNQAKMIIGPHGGALANILYVGSDNNCKVCEFVNGKHTTVQKCRPFGKNYNRLLGYAPETYLDYYLIPFEIGSDKEETFINIDNFKYFLNSIKL